MFNDIVLVNPVITQSGIYTLYKEKNMLRNQNLIGKGKRDISTSGFNVL